MKCLEKLSLVDDECMKDLQKDIEKVIESYLNITKKCEETFEEIRNSLDKWQIKKINKILCNTDVFWGGEPVYINGDGWQHDILKFFDFRTDKDSAESLKDIMNTMERFSHDTNNWIDIENESYWMFREGANGELLFVKETELLEFIKKQIKWESIETQIELYRMFKNIQENI